MKRKQRNIQLLQSLRKLYPQYPDQNRKGKHIQMLTALTAIFLVSMFGAAMQQGGEASVSVGRTPTGQMTAVNGDVNGDGRVDILDLSQAIAKDGQRSDNADLSGDGTVGAADIAIVLSGWTW